MSITDQGDVDFGSFYKHFDSKAASVAAGRADRYVLGVALFAA